MKTRYAYFLMIVIPAIVWMASMPSNIASQSRTDQPGQVSPGSYEGESGQHQGQGSMGNTPVQPQDNQAEGQVGAGQAGTENTATSPGIGWGSLIVGLILGFLAGMLVRRKPATIEESRFRNDRAA